MFGSGKPTASLSSGLLARKGQARPAMRPQGFHGSSMNLEDLGWNDMGEEHAPAVAIVPAPAPIAPPMAVVPPVLVERETLMEEIGADEDVADEWIEPETSAEIVPIAVAKAEPVKPVSLATAQRLQREVNAGKPKAAFTLRLDTERHLKLRLASACRLRSAQALVTEALDAFLDTLPEIDPLVSQLAETQPKRKSR
jgi:hypothetical protein